MTNKRLIQTLRKEKTDRTPFWFMRQAGRYLPEYRELRATCNGFLDLCYTPKKAIEVTLQPLRRYGMDAAILFSDILVIPDALGMRVEFKEGEGPHLQPIASLNDLPQRSETEFLAHLSPVFETIAGVKAKLSKETALIGFSGAPWTLACYMIHGKGGGEFSKAKEIMRADKQAYAAINAKLEHAILLYLDQQVHAGIDAVQLFDSWAGLLSVEDFMTWVVEPTRRIVGQFKAMHPTIPVIGFPRLAGNHYAAYANQTGVDGMSVDFEQNLSAMKSQISPEVTLQGNLNPELLADDLETTLMQTREILKHMQGKSHIFNLGHGMLPHTPLAHMDALCELLRQ